MGDGTTGITWVYACSGVANTGLLADQIPRFHAEGAAVEMTCLAATGAETPESVWEATARGR